MSASLVGSEMCIRDRHQSVHGNTAKYLQRHLLLSSLRSARAPASSPPVSYTHLTLPTICSV
eukprot:1034916-Alexandrium_andersonii.AAC.1